MRDTKSINRKYQRAVTVVKKIESVEVIEGVRAVMSCPAGQRETSSNSKVMKGGKDHGNNCCDGGIYRL